jgi:branched-chain amino acid transport system permease protein
MAYFLQQVLNGLHTSALYALLAFGYSLTHGVIRRTNLAYGPIFAFCGQVMILAAVFGYQALWLTLPAAVAFGVAIAFVYGGILGSVLSRGVFRPLAEEAPNTIVAATLGVSLVLMELGRIAADTKDYWLPPMLALPVVFVDGGYKVTLTLVQLIDMAIVAAALLAGSLVLARSRLGREWRAVSDDPFAASMCGVNVAAVFSGSVVAGALAAALAGSLAAFYFGNISFGTGLIFGLKVLFVTAVGGYHSPPRAAAGAAGVGMAEALWTGYFAADWRDAAIFVALIVLLVLRPTDQTAAIRV